MRIPKPILIDDAIEATVRTIANNKSNWMDAQMKRIMPPEVYALSKSEKSRDRMKLSKWMVQNKVALREHPSVRESNGRQWIGESMETTAIGPTFSKSELMFGDKVISLLSFRIKDGKIEQMVKDFPL